MPLRDAAWRFARAGYNETVMGCLSHQYGFHAETLRDAAIFQRPKIEVLGSGLRDVEEPSVRDAAFDAPSPGDVRVCVRVCVHMCVHLWCMRVVCWRVV